MNLTVSLGRFFPTTLVLALVAGCGRGQPPQAAAPPATPVKLAVVESGTIDDSSDYLASLQSRRSVTLQTQIDGRVTRILVKSGDVVASGDLMIQVDPAKQQAAVSSSSAAAESARAELENARATLKSLEAQRLSNLSQVKFSEQEYQRYSTLYSQGAVARQSLDQFTNSLQAARASLASIEAQMRAQQATITKSARDLQQSLANVREQEVELQYYRITAPFAGTVGDIPVKVGDYVNDSTKLITITQNQPLEANIYVPIEKAPQLRTGMTVQLKDGQGKTMGNGQVFFISPNVEDLSQSVLIKALFNNSNNQLRADQSVRAQVVWDKRLGVLIPTTAISRLAGQNFVFVAQVQGESQLIARQKPVKLGEIQGNNYQVIDGLKPGEKIVTSGILNLSDGAPIAPES